MKYFNIKEVLRNPEVYVKEYEELKSYPRNKLFLAIEKYKRERLSKNSIIEELTEEGYGEVESGLALEEYQEFISKYDNYKLGI